MEVKFYQVPRKLPHVMGGVSFPRNQTHQSPCDNFLEMIDFRNFTVFAYFRPQTEGWIFSARSYLHKPAVTTPFM